MIGTWQQDFGFGARSDLIGFSSDGGRSWRRSLIPGLTVCTGGTADFASDPWVSAGPDGTAYFSGTVGSATADPPPVAVVASRSTNGGRTWSRPTTIAPPDPGNDSDAITASPSVNGHAYAVWANWDHGQPTPKPNTLDFSRTTDRGSSWSPRVVVDAPGPAAIDFSGHVVAVRTGSGRDGRDARHARPGTLVIVFARADFSSPQPRGELRSARSLDEGRTWEPSVLIGSQPVGQFFDPDSGNELPQAGFPSATAAPDGSVYAAFERNIPAPGGGVSGGIGVARSRDGGRTWVNVRTAGSGAFAFHPAIAVDARGTVGLTFYDLRGDRPGDPTLTTDSWIAGSRDGGRSWQETHLAGPFDLRGAPFAANGHALGEYQGLTALGGNGFGAITTLAAPLARNGTTDIFFTRIGRS